MCQAMAAASSLDEVIDVHDAYLLSIQRQCFIVPDKLVGIACALFSWDFPWNVQPLPVVIL